MLNTIDGAPDAVKIACPVLVGGKAGDYIKGLPIETSGITLPSGHFFICLDGVCAEREKFPYGLETVK